MEQQTIEISDETTPVCKVEKHNATQNRIRFKNNIASIGDEVTIIKSGHHKELLEKINDADKYIIRINQLQDKLDKNNTDALTKQLAVYEKQVDKLTKSNNSFKQWNDNYKSNMEDLERKVEKYKETIADKDATTISLTDKNATLQDEVNQHQETIDNLQETIQQQAQTLSDLKEMNDAIGKEKDKLEKQLEDAVDISEHQQLKEKVAELETNLEKAQSDCEYWKKSYKNQISSSDEVVAQNESLIADNEKLRNDNNAINETNKILNQNIMALNSTFDETKQELQSDFQNKEKELKETIKNNQLHIDELTDKYQSLLVSKDNIPQKQHYNEILALKDELSDAKKEIDKLNGDIEVKLAKQKSDMEIEHTNEKAQMLVAYNNDLNHSKLKYNELAMAYNNLIDELHTITKWNALFDNRHEKIRKDKEHAQLMEIPAEQLPPADEHVLEYVLKDKD